MRVELMQCLQYDMYFEVDSESDYLKKISAFLRVKTGKKRLVNYCVIPLNPDSEEYRTVKNEGNFISLLEDLPGI